MVAPFELEVGKATSFSFVANDDIEYCVGVTFERALDFEILDTTLQAIFNNKDFDVLVEEDGKAIAVGDWSGMGYGQNISLYLAEFEVQKGRHYDVRITPRKAYPELSVTNPLAEVDVAFWTYYTR
ncbi:MAG: hypothetical protein QM758_08785 [Armatimonas sp.]